MIFKKAAFCFGVFTLLLPSCGSSLTFSSKTSESSSFSSESKTLKNHTITFHCGSKQLETITVNDGYTIGPYYDYNNKLSNYSGYYFQGWYLDSSLKNKIGNGHYIKNDLDLYASLMTARDVILAYIVAKGPIEVTDSPVYGAAGNVHYNNVTNHFYADCVCGAYELQTRLTDGYSTFKYTLTSTVLDTSTGEVLPAGTILATGEFSAVPTYSGPRVNLEAGITFSVSNVNYNYYRTASVVNNDIGTTFKNMLNSLYQMSLGYLSNYENTIGVRLIQ